MSEFSGVYYFASPMTKQIPEHERIEGIPVPPDGFTIQVPTMMRLERWYNVWFKLPSGHVEGRSFLAESDELAQTHAHEIAAQYGLEVVKVEPTHAYQGVYETEGLTRG